MKAMVNAKGVLLTYQLSRNEYASFLEQVEKQKASGKPFDYHNGFDVEDSWIQADEWIK